jgi:hypothetical protein
LIQTDAEDSNINELEIWESPVPCPSKDKRDNKRGKKARFPHKVTIAKGRNDPSLCGNETSELHSSNHQVWLLVGSQLVPHRSITKTKMT